MTIDDNVPKLYLYKGDWYCENHGNEVKNEVGFFGEDWDERELGHLSSDWYPKGPYPNRHSRCTVCTGVKPDIVANTLDTSSEYSRYVGSKKQAAGFISVAKDPLKPLPPLTRHVSITTIKDNKVTEILLPYDERSKDPIKVA